MKVGDLVRITETPWNQFGGEYVVITKIDADSRGFDFVVPESRGHAPAHFIERNLGNFDLEKFGIKI